MLDVLITNLVYGEPYTSVFLNLHLKSLIENLGKNALGPRSMYLIYTDDQNIEKLAQHKRFQDLQAIIKTVLIKIDLKLDYRHRYNLQTIQLQHSLRIALEHDLFLHQACADVYYGPNFWLNACNLVEQFDLDGLFGFAIRSTLETTADLIGNQYLDSDSLFDLAYDNLHPLWIAANWNAPHFTNYPFTILLTESDQIICRSFSIPAVLFKPSVEMANIDGAGDISILPQCRNLYVESDWQNLPMIEMVQLGAFFPPFSRKKASVNLITQWAKQRIPMENFSNLLYHQVIKKTNTPLNDELFAESQKVSSEIVLRLQHP